MRAVNAAHFSMQRLTRGYLSVDGLWDLVDYHKCCGGSAIKFVHVQSTYYNMKGSL